MMAMLWNYSIVKGGMTMENLTMPFNLMGAVPRQFITRNRRPPLRAVCGNDEEGGLT